MPDQDVLSVEDDISVEIDPAPGSPAGWRGRVAWMLRPVLFFAGSRLAVLAAAGVAAELKPGLGVSGALQTWDSAWFLTLIRDGYPTAIQTSGGHVVPSTLGFFPLYALAVRAVHRLGFGVVAAAFVVTTIAGLAAAMLLWRLVAVVRDTGVADRATALFCFFPGSVVLSMVYSEALMVALALGCLLCLHRRRWLWAGVLAGLAGATRMTGLALAVACTWAAGAAVLRRREWRALVAPILAPLGVVAFFAYLHVHAGSASAYVRTQSDGWGQKADPGAVVDALRAFAKAPFADTNVTVIVAGLAFLAGAALAMLRTRPPALFVSYTIPAVALALLSPSIGFRPRFLLIAFPLIVAVAEVLGSIAYPIALGCAATMLSSWTILILTSTTVGP